MVTDRRHFAKLAAVVAAAPLAACGAATRATSAMERALKPITVSVGRQPAAGESVPISEYMLQHKLFEKAAAEHGYDLTVNYLDYPSATPMVELMLANKLDFGMWGNTRIIGIVASSEPVVPLMIAEGHLKFVVAVPQGSSIRTLDDLQGKTVGALLGGAEYNVLTQMLTAQYGSGDPAARHITVVNTPSSAASAQIPRGIDAAVVDYASFLQANAAVGTQAIANSYGYTEAYYRGPAGHGAGHLIPSAKKSPFWPEGYYCDRAFWVARKAIVDADPNLVVAFAVAEQRAIKALAAMKPGAVSNLVKKDWGLTPQDGGKLVDDGLLLHVRRWAWPTEGDATSLVTMSGLMAASKQLDAPITLKALIAALKPAAPLLKRAYDIVKVPKASAFLDHTHDLRGYPSWEWQRWRSNG